MRLYNQKGKEVKRIAVTGGTGFIGSVFLEKYASIAEYIVASEHPEKARFEHDNITYLKSDYSYESLCSVFDGCDAVVHLAAKRPDRLSEEKAESYIENIVVSDNVFRAAQYAGITNVVNISSVSVYDDKTDSPYLEGKEHPMSFYGFSKLSSEIAADMYNRKYGMKIKSLRLAQVIGSGERGGYMLAIFADRCMKGEALDIFGDGSPRRGYVYVKDAARAIYLALCKEEVFGTFNIGMNFDISNLELAQAFCKAYGNSAGYVLHPEKTVKAEKGYMCCDKARDILGFVAEYDIIGAICDMRSEK